MNRFKRPQRHVYKIESKRFARESWSFNLTRDEAYKNDELVAIGESEVLRMIDRINKKDNMQGKYLEIKESMSEVKRGKTSTDSKDKMKALNKELDDLLFQPDYIMIEFNYKKHYKTAIEQGVILNGRKFERFYGTAGGIKKNTIIFVSSSIHDELLKRIECGRREGIEIVPAKYEAYMSLASSASTPVRDIHHSKILVVEDHMTSFKADVTEVKECVGENTSIQHVEGMEIELEASDGNGAISPRLANDWANDMGDDYIPTGFIMRNAFCKGSVFTFEIEDFTNEIAIGEHGKSKYVQDIWGDAVDVTEVDLVICASMLKLWYAYDSIEHYMECCNESGFGFSITKMIPKVLENERAMTYQFLQSLYLDDEDIDELAKPTIDEIKSVLDGDYRKTILYLKGEHMEERNVFLESMDYVQALMIDKRMMDDPFVRYRIHSMMQKQINDAKFGRVKVNGNYTIIASDIYGLLEHVFGIEIDGVLGKGLLGEEEFYSNYWNERDVDKVVAMRAPMCTHANIKKMNLVENDKLKKWFKHMPNCTIFNSWDSTCETLSGSD